jgi:predicted acylesterase/phospholipase RssA
MTMPSINIEHLVLSGGGLLGISYIGLFKYFEETQIVSNIKSITGCSAGAIFGSLLAIGYNSQQLDTIVKSMIFKEYLTINVDSILNFTTTKGFETGKKLNLFIKKYIKEKTGNENITFLQIQEKYNIKLQIGVTNLTKYKFELFNVDTTPDIPIEKAISASIAIPFVFEPIIIGDDIFCDGGLLDNLPIENVIDMDILLHKDKQETNKDTKDTKDIKNKDKQETDKDKQETNHTTENPSNTNNDLNIIGVYLISKIPIINKDNYKAIGISQYINLITHTLSKNIISKKQNYENINKNKYKIISIEIPCDIMSFIKINATHQDIDNIINIAYTITKNDLNF